MGVPSFIGQITYNLMFSKHNNIGELQGVGLQNACGLQNAGLHIKIYKNILL